MARELLSGRGKPSPRSDVYSLGKVVYFALTGEPAEYGLDSDRPSEIVDGIPPSVDAPVLACMGRLDRRPESGGRLASVIRAASDEHVASVEAERKAREEAEQKAKEEAEQKAKEEAERKAKEEAERKAKEEAKRKAEEAAERRAMAEAETKAKEEAERKAREESERKAREEAERKAKEEAERKAKEAERKAKEETEQKAKEEAEQKAKEARAAWKREAKEQKRLRERAEEARKAELARKAMEAERKAKEEAERKAKEEAERKAKEAERKAKEEAEHRARGEAKAEAERKARREVERESSEGNDRWNQGDSGLLVGGVVAIVLVICVGAATAVWYGVRAEKREADEATLSHEGGLVEDQTGADAANSGSSPVEEGIAAVPVEGDEPKAGSRSGSADAATAGRADEEEKHLEEHEERREERDGGDDRTEVEETKTREEELEASFSDIDWGFAEDADEEEDWLSDDGDSGGDDKIDLDIDALTRDAPDVKVPDSRKVPPKVMHSPIRSGRGGQTVTLRLTLTPDDDYTGTMYYRGAPNGSWNSMDISGNGRISVRLKLGSWLAGDHSEVEYYFLVDGPGGTSGAGSRLVPYSFNVR